MATNDLPETTKTECEQIWQLAFQLWYIVCLEDHQIFAEYHTNLGKLMDSCVLHHSIFH